MGRREGGGASDGAAQHRRKNGVPLISRVSSCAEEGRRRRESGGKEEVVGKEAEWRKTGPVERWWRGVKKSVKEAGPGGKMWSRLNEFTRLRTCALDYRTLPDKLPYTVTQHHCKPLPCTITPPCIVTYRNTPSHTIPPNTILHHPNPTCVEGKEKIKQPTRCRNVEP